ncbi:PKD domain-containing protein [Candidatus Peregrinibacteria bacterium]|nr:PKD domain-containing protein [Candidatus Peregrinibacteria bacterium]
MRKTIVSIVIAFLSFFPVVTFSQDNPADETIEIPTLQAVLQVEDIVEQGKNVIFDASGSINPVPEKPLSHEWDFGDGTKEAGEEVVHVYQKSGKYQIKLTTVDSEGNTATAEKEIFVYQKLLLLVSNDANSLDRIQNFEDSARQRGIYVKVLGSFDSVTDFIAEDVLLQKLSESINDIRRADHLVFLTRSSFGLTLLSRFKETFKDVSVFQNKDIIFVSNARLSLLTTIAQGTFQAMAPKRIILTRSEAMWPLVESENIDDFLMILEQRGLEYELINTPVKLSITTFLSYMMNFMIDRGISSNSLKLILMLPVIVTVVAFMKQVIGISTLGVYTPSILALSFMALDIRYGLFMLLILLLIGTLVRIFMRHYRLLYIPRMAIVLSFVSITILGVMFLGAIFNISHLVSLSIFPMLIMSTLTEQFVSIQTGKGFKQAFFIISETILVAVLNYYVATWEFMQTLMLSHPELVFVFILINIGLGRFTGLRLSEYFRFREVLRHTEEE